MFLSVQGDSRGNIVGGGGSFYPHKMFIFPARQINTFIKGHIYLIFATFSSVALLAPQAIAIIMGSHIEINFKTLIRILSFTNFEGALPHGYPPGSVNKWHRIIQIMVCHLQLNVIYMKPLLKYLCTDSIHRILWPFLLRGNFDVNNAVAPVVLSGMM